MLARLKEINRQPETFQYTAILSFIIFLFLQFQWTSILTFTFIFISLVQLMRIKFNKIQERGLISLLPRTLQIHLLDRSIFDLLCDIWYIPKISLYIQAFFKPFVQNISPEEAASALQELPDSAKKAIMTKGLINFLPNFLQSAIMPQQQLEIEDNTNKTKQRYINIDDNEDQDSLGSTNTTISTKFNTQDDIYDRNQRLFESHIFITPHTPKHPMSGLISSSQYEDNNYSNDSYSYNKVQNQYQRNKNKTFKEITINDEKRNEREYSQKYSNRNSPQKSIEKNTQRSINKNQQHEFSFNNNLFKLSQNEPNTFIQSQDKSQKNNKNLNNSLHQSTSSDDDNLQNSSSMNFYNTFQNRGTLSDEEFPKTKVIASSYPQLISSSEDISKTSSAKQKLKPEIADKWDKLELFRNRIKENYKKFIQIKSTQNLDQNSIQNKPNLISSARSILSLFHNIMELRKMGNIQNIDNKKLLKLFIISSAFMGAQVMTSRRARRWMINTSLMFLYVLSFVLTTGTLGIIAMKYHQEQQQKQILNKKIIVKKQENKQDNNSFSN